jgi:hypothetical protein
MARYHTDEAPSTASAEASGRRGDVPAWYQAWDIVPMPITEGRSRGVGYPQEETDSWVGWARRVPHPLLPKHGSKQHIAPVDSMARCSRGPNKGRGCSRGTAFYAVRRTKGLRWLGSRSGYVSSRQGRLGGGYYCRGRRRNISDSWGDCREPSHRRRCQHFSDRRYDRAPTSREKQHNTDPAQKSAQLLAPLRCRP